jgi:predicted esterase
LLPGCKTSTEPGPSDPPPVPRDGRLSARPGSPSVEPTLGETPLGLETTRDGFLYVPQSYSPDTPTPLFVGLHGATGEASNWASYKERAEERGMVFMAPNSRAVTWDVTTAGFGEDVEFINRALRHTFERCRIDASKIVLGGFSDGASYALSLGLTNGDLFSHLVAYSPGFLFAPDPVGTPLVYISHGTQDQILSITVTRDSIVAGLRDAGYNVTYEEFDGAHEVPAEITESALDWFLA